MTKESEQITKAEEAKKEAFLEAKIFTGLENQHKGIRDKSYQYFSEADFKTILERAEYFGLGIYKILAFRKKKPYASATHEDYNKKTTHPKWYNTAFIHLKKTEKDLLFAADYRISKKLLVDRSEE